MRFGHTSSFLVQGGRQEDCLDDDRRTDHQCVTRAAPPASYRKRLDRSLRPWWQYVDSEFRRLLQAMGIGKV